MKPHHLIWAYKQSNGSTIKSTLRLSSLFYSRNVLPSIPGAQQMYSARRGQLVFAAYSHHLSRSCASNLCKPLAIMSHSSTYLHLFFGLPCIVPSTFKCRALTRLLSSFILSICHNHCNLCFLRNSSNLSTLVISRIFSLFILSFKVFHISFAAFSFL